MNSDFYELKKISEKCDNSSFSSFDEEINFWATMKQHDKKWKIKQSKYEWYY